jgi:NTE family protein
LSDKPSIGVCLSGGGFRASLFALGCLRYLAEAELLSSVVAIPAVSGGSIAAAKLADQADQLAARGSSVEAYLELVYGPFRNVVTTRNLRNLWLRRSVGGMLARHRRGRGVVLGEVLSEHLFATRDLRDLPAGPQIILTATDLAAGRAFRFSRDFVGSYDMGYMATPAALPLGLAVAASAAVPALFPPVNLSTARLGFAGINRTLALADGGVYDNLGLEWFQGWSAGRPGGSVRPEFLIVVNAGAPLTPTTHPLGGVRAAWRAKDVQYSQTTKLRSRWFVDELLSGRLSGVYVACASDPRTFGFPDGTPIDPAAYAAALPSELANALGRLRTDLDRFTTDEADLLSYHGYWTLHARMAALHPALAAASPSWVDYRDLPPQQTQRLLGSLERGARRRLH